jgi:osmotically-inducible protein OsmY
MKKPLWLPFVVALAGATAITGCASFTRATNSTDQYVDDATITSKVKAALLDESGLKSFKISVDTSKGVVQLSGVVNSDRLKARAGEVAASITGVRDVQNNIVLN